MVGKFREDTKHPRAVQSHTLTLLLEKQSWSSGHCPKSYFWCKSNGLIKEAFPFLAELSYFTPSCHPAAQSLLSSHCTGAVIMEDRGKKACSHHLAGLDDTVSMVFSHHSFCISHVFFSLTPHRDIPASNSAYNFQLPKAVTQNLCHFCLHNTDHSLTDHLIWGMQWLLTVS